MKKSTLVLILILLITVIVLPQKKKAVKKQTNSKKEFIAPEMVFVKGGTFEMGSNEGEEHERPIHTVTLGDFYIGKYEVTQKEWEAVVGHSPSNFKGANRPTENVSWSDVQKFIKKLNAQSGEHYRLPTEAEWEYAARGGSKSSGYIYSGSNDINEVAWYGGYDKSGNAEETHEVGQKQPNELGIYDMSGNVAEWCNDRYNEYYYNNSKSKNPQGPSSGEYRVLRGGSWNISDNVCRSSYRYYYLADDWHNYLGFRLVQEINDKDISRDEVKIVKQIQPKKQITKTTVAFEVPEMKGGDDVNAVYQAPVTSDAELGKTTQTVDNTDINLDALNLPDNADQGGKEVVEEKQEIVRYVEEMPSFPNGQDELMKFFAQNVKYPEVARRAGVEGKVFVQFVVGKDGRVGQVSIAKGIGAGCDEEAIRVVKMMPKWTPGKQNGRTVLVQVIVPIIFKLQ